MSKLIVGVNDLATTNPELAKEWNYAKNEGLKPTEISAGSGIKVWWLLPYDDPETGRHFDFEWRAYIYSRARGSDCPYLAGRAAWSGFNDLATTHPQIAKEWHPTKNGDFKPCDVTAGSRKKVWWLYSYDDPKTGKHFDFEWKVKISHRTNGNGCPYLSGRALQVGFNDLATTHPQIAKEWHPTKNGNLKPTDVSAGSREKVWWLYPYDDPMTGKHFNFEWEAPISHRANGSGCPYLSGQSVWSGFNDLATTNPELIKEWHPIKNGDLKPTNVSSGMTKKVWWLLSYDDPNTGKHFDFEWESEINSRIKGNRCPYLAGKATWIGYNDLTTTHPELIKEWHPTKNGNLKPTDLTAGSHKKVWWLLPYDDLNTAKHFDFEWMAEIKCRVLGIGCPYISGKAVWIGFNNFDMTHPELAKEWHPTKNKNLKPADVSAWCNKKVWWLYPYDDPKTGKHFEFEWEATISNRTNGEGCPYLSGRLVWTGFNDLATTNPELVNEWDFIKNEDLKPTAVSIGYDKKVWWSLPYDDPKSGKHFDFEWLAKISYRIRGSGCPYLSNKAVWVGFNDLETTNPELSKEWHPTKNGNLKPTDFTAGSQKKVWWMCSYDDPKTGKHFDFEWEANIYSRARGNSCPFISSSKMMRFTYDFLKHMGLEFKAEKRFPKCKDKSTLPFDIYLVKQNKIIELDGIQHFAIVDSWGGEKVFLSTRKHDEIKDNFCVKNNIPLLRIPYIYDAVHDIEEVKILIENFIKYGIIPDKIKDFYESEQRNSYINLLSENK